MKVEIEVDLEVEGDTVDAPKHTRKGKFKIKFPKLRRFRPQERDDKRERKEKRKQRGKV